MKKNKKGYRYKGIVRAMCALLSCVFMLLSFASCSNAPISSSKEALRVVGTVGSYEVLYDELYFLVNSYRSGLEKKYGEYEKLDAENAKKFEDELREQVYSSVVIHYATLSLCAERGLTLEDEGLEKRVQDYVDSVVDSDFGSSHSAYRESLDDYGLSDRYVRFTAAVDLLYVDLMTKMLEDGLIIDDDESIKQIVKNDFARTWHIMISNDEGESVEENRKKAEEALSKYRDGSMSMYKLIGSVYNEDLSLTDLDGLYFARGSLDEKYEEAAFSLAVGEVSDIVETVGTNAQGQTVDVFYIIQRLEIEDAYVEKNLASLKEKYRESVMYAMLEKRCDELTFIPNDYASSLTLSTLTPPAKAFPIGIVLAVSAVCLVIGAGIACGVVLAVKRGKEKKNAMQIAKKSNKK